MITRKLLKAACRKQSLKVAYLIKTHNNKKYTIVLYIVLGYLLIIKHRE